MTSLGKVMRVAYYQRTRPDTPSPAPPRREVEVEAPDDGLPTPRRTRTSKRNRRRHGKHPKHITITTNVPLAGQEGLEGENQHEKEE